MHLIWDTSWEKLICSWETSRQLLFCDREGENARRGKLMAADKQLGVQQQESCFMLQKNPLMWVVSEGQEPEEGEQGDGGAK